MEILLSGRRWESLEQLHERPQSYVERDYRTGDLRYTYYPSGETLFQHQYYKHEGKLGQWKHNCDTFFRALPPDILIVTSALKYVGRPADVIGFDGFER